MPAANMSDGSIIQVLAVWGALLSTLLASLRIWDFWQGRFRVDVSTLFTSSEEIGHKVSVRNLSGKPLILGHWEVVRVSGRWPRRTSTVVVSADFDSDDIVISGHSTLGLPFVEENHFPWGRSLDGDRLAIRLHFAGRRPVVRYLGA